MTRLCLLAIAVSPIAFGQLDPNSVTVSASRSVVLQPDEAVFGIGVAASPDVTLTQILTALQKLGVSGGDLNGISIAPPADRGTPGGLLWEWQFTLAVPLVNIKDTQLILMELQQSPDTAARGVRLSFGVSGVRSSPALVASQQCPVAELITDARAHAQKLAAAAGLALGPIQGIADGAVAVPTSAVRTGDFAAGAVLAAARVVPFFVSRSVAFCSISVKFRLGG